MNLAMVGVISLFLLQKPGVPAVPPAAPLAAVQYSLADRYGNAFVNGVFDDNILLTMAYMRGAVHKGERVVWGAVRAPFRYTLTLKPGETFAFHDRLLPEFQGKVVATTNAHFDSTEGFRSDGYLVGDGVCHLASFINVAAKEAGLAVVAPTPHNFAKINDVAKKDGVAIYYDPTAEGSSALQNLYVTNNKAGDVVFTFTYDGTSLDISVSEELPALLPLQSAVSPLV